MKNLNAMLWIGAIVVGGVFAAQAGAAFMTVEVESGGPNAHTLVVNTASGTVSLPVYVYFASANGSYTDDGLNTLYGAVKSKESASKPLSGDCSFIGVSSLSMGTGTAWGTVQDLDSDTYKDVGGKNTQTQGGLDGNWICASASTGSYVLPTNANRLQIGTVEFTYSNADLESNTVINWSFRLKTGTPAASNINAFKVDGTTYTVPGSSTNMALGQGVNLVYVPEPLTLALLAAGGAILLRRKRRAA